jgi:hypothetical protein
MADPHPTQRIHRHSDEFFHRKGFKALARSQGVKPVERFEDLTGGWPEDERDDGFESAVLEWRRGEARGAED